MPSMRLSVDKIQLRKEPLGLCECQQELQNVKLKKTNKRNTEGLWNNYKKCDI